MGSMGEHDTGFINNGSDIGDGSYPSLFPLRGSAKLNKRIKLTCKARRWSAERKVGGRLDIYYIVLTRGAGSAYRTPQYALPTSSNIKKTGLGINGHKKRK